MNYKNDKQPYVIYKISADIDERGIGFVLDKAINSFVKHNPRFEIKTKKEMLSSSRYEAQLMVYDNGNLDFNMKELSDFLDKSGRLPNSENLKPKIKIEPIPHNYSPPKISSSNESWVKTIDKLTSEKTRLLIENEKKDKDLQGLTKLLSEKQDELALQSEKIRELEDQFENGPFNIDIPSYSLAREYCKCYESFLQSADEDWSILNQTRDRQLFLDTSGGEGIESLVNYISKKSGIEFSSLKEVESWENEHLKDWSKSSTCQEYNSKLKELEKDIEVIEKLKEFGASQDLINSLNSSYHIRQEQIKSLEDQIRNAHNSWINDTKKLNLIAKAKENYPKFREVKRNTDERKRAFTEIPVLFYISENNNIEVYLPYFNNQESLTHNVVQKVSKMGKVFRIRDHSKPRDKQDDEFDNFTYLNLELDDKQLTSLILTREPYLCTDPIINALGITVTKKVFIECYPENI